ncbi:MAG TPA: GerMN domain-containing protein, partial [Acidimicrobiales bacterium]|nr:GerMN domain-containing protein [Acidimicrobiales bacterium]
EQVLALAQIVFTLSEIPDVARVQFTLAGSPIEVPTPAGSTTGPVTRDAFPTIAPAPQPPNPGQ